jgi:hypothetical protein
VRRKAYARERAISDLGLRRKSPLLAHRIVSLALFLLLKSAVTVYALQLHPDILEGVLQWAQKWRSRRCSWEW